MIPMPDHEVPPAAQTFAECLRRGIPRAYAVLFFSTDRILGWLLIAISFFSPDIALPGLLGVIIAACLGLALGFDRRQIIDGYILFNPLLACMSLAYLHRWYHFSPTYFVLLWLLVLLGSLIVTISLQYIISRLFGLSSQSLPAIVTSAGLIFLIMIIRYHPPRPHFDAGILWMEMYFLPDFLRGFLKSFGAMLMVPYCLPGLLIFLALLRTSVLMSLSAFIAYLGGVAGLTLLGLPTHAGIVSVYGYNFLLCGVALGTAYYIPSRSSLALAFLSGILAAVVGLCLVFPLRMIALEPGALPFNLVVLSLVLTLRHRTHYSGLVPIPLSGLSPEKAAQGAMIERLRFPYLSTPALFLPFHGEATVTQGVNGSITHRGEWNWALDFEKIVDASRHRGTGETLSDYYSYDMPVLSPCNGIVTAIRADVSDNSPGMNNPAESWGNYVIIHSDAGYHVMLAHLKQFSITVSPGQRVSAKEQIALGGSSGRSPVPHLHMQIQDSALPGAPTKPFCIKHFIDHAATSESPLYVTAGIPEEGHTVSSPVADSGLYSLLCSWLPGQYRYRVKNSNGTSGMEVVTLDFDEYGRYRFRSDSGKNQLTVFLSEGVLYAVDYEGSPESLLASLSAGIARVPAIQGKPVPTWTDTLGNLIFRNLPGRIVQSLADILFSPRVCSYHYKLVAQDHSWVIHATLHHRSQSPLPGSLPVSLVTTLANREGVASLIVERADGGREEFIRVKE